MSCNGDDEQVIASLAIQSLRWSPRFTRILANRDVGGDRRFLARAAAAIEGARDHTRVELCRATGLA